MNKVENLKVIWDYMCLNQEVKKCDTIFGAGCHDLDIPKKCVELYKEGYADKIIFSGGLGKVTTDIWNKPEAVIFKEVAIELGVPEKNIFVETESTNTGDNFRFTKKLIEEKNLNIQSFIIVTTPYAERRCYASFKAIMEDKECIITSYDNSFDNFIKEKENQEVSLDEKINVLVGDLQRMKVYAQKGWQIKQDIPDNVWNAYEELVSMGYDKYVIE